MSPLPNLLHGFFTFSIQKSLMLLATTWPQHRNRENMIFLIFSICPWRGLPSGKLACCNVSLPPSLLESLLSLGPGLQKVGPNLLWPRGVSRQGKQGPSSLPARYRVLPSLLLPPSHQRRSSL